MERVRMSKKLVWSGHGKPSPRFIGSWLISWMYHTHWSKDKERLLNFRSVFVTMASFYLH